MLGDIPDIDARPPDTTLFVCRLNPKTGEEGLRIVFSRFGRITNIDLIRDRKTQQSLCYAFITFEKAENAERAFLGMQKAIIDSYNVVVDFSQSLKGPKYKT